MKVPPKRKGNPRISGGGGGMFKASMKVPPKRKGNVMRWTAWATRFSASMKVPPKRKGNSSSNCFRAKPVKSLNESPSEKEGKFVCLRMA